MSNEQKEHGPDFYNLRGKTLDECIVEKAESPQYAKIRTIGEISDETINAARQSVEKAQKITMSDAVAKNIATGNAALFEISGSINTREEDRGIGVDKTVDQITNEEEK